MIVAVIAAILITFFTINSHQNGKVVFKEYLFAQDSLKTVLWPSFEAADSVRISDFKGKFVVLDFWANGSDASLNSQKELAIIQAKNPDMLQVIAASVGHPPKTVHSYIQKYHFPFLFVDGSQHFSSFNVPGLPAQLIFNPNGNLKNVFLGYPDDSQYDSLRAFINDKE